MNSWIITLIAIVAGAVIGFLVTNIFNKLPEAWLQDYGYDEKSPDFRLSKRMSLLPHGAISALICALLFAACPLFSYNFLFNGIKPMHLAVIVLSAPIIVMVMMADRLNRIIPDQFSIFLGVMGLLELAGDYLEGSVWISADAKWYVPLLNRVIGAGVGFLFLFILGVITITFFGKEGMGQGDMKLLSACGFLVGAYGLVVVLYVSVLTAFVFALPMFIKKRIRIHNEEKRIKESKDPVATRAALQREKAKIHFADDPDYLAFGPFIALATGIFLVMEPIFFNQLHIYLEFTGLLF